MDTEQPAKKITFHYEKHPDYKIIFANGALGGSTPRGDIKFDFFIEYLEVPEESAHSITPDGLGPEIEPKPSSPSFARQSQIGVIMTPKQAKALAYWLMGQVDTIEKKEPQNG